MEVYLNVIEMGDGIYGAEAAAQNYFHKPAAHLTKSEAALIAVCLPNPRRFSPSHPSPYIQKRRATILKLMPNLGNKLSFPIKR
jgi:monofunctional biosynthetic peptidoglycan transglycosylase